MGILSYQAIECLQPMQWLAGLTIDSSSGRRYTTTLRKLPVEAPIAKRNTIHNVCGIAKLNFPVYIYIFVTVHTFYRLLSFALSGL